MIRELHLEESATACLVLALQAASYRVEADLMGFEEIPPLMDTPEKLQTCGEIFYGYFMDGILSGIISYKADSGVLDIHRMAVHPSCFRMGIAGKLLEHVEGLEHDCRKTLVCTGKANMPAINLYLKYGFHKVRDMEIRPGIFLTAFEKG